MGQKVHPYGMRVGYIKPWKSRWYSQREYIKFLHQDLKVRDFIKSKWGFAGIADVEIERSGKKVRVSISTARPGILIGRRGSEIDKIRDEVQKATGEEVQIDIKEVKVPQLSAQLVAENISQQLEKRIAFRRAMKKAVQQTMDKGAKGVRIRCAGRLGGAEIARTEAYKQGSIPLSTFRADVDYGFTEARTTYGAIGIKVWIYKGDVLIRKEVAEKTPQSHVEISPAEEAAPNEKSAKAEVTTDVKEKSPKAEGSADVAAPVDVKEDVNKDAPASEQKEEGTK